MTRAPMVTSLAALGGVLALAGRVAQWDLVPPIPQVFVPVVLLLIGTIATPRAGRWQSIGIVASLLLIASGGLALALYPGSPAASPGAWLLWPTPAASWFFIVCGASLLLRYDRLRAPRLADLLGLGGLAIAWSGVTAWILARWTDGQSLWDWGTMLIAGLGLQAVAVVGARPGPWVGGFLTGQRPGTKAGRVLLPIAVGAPFALGWITAASLRHDLLDSELGLFLAVGGQTALLGGLFVWVAMRLNRERASTEAALRRANAELEARVSERTADLGRANEALESEVAVRRLAERAAEESKVELIDFIENALEGLVWVDPRGIIVWANQSELDLLGYTRDEFMDHSIARFHVDPEVVDGMMAQLAAGERIKNREARIRARDGSIRHVLISGDAVWDQGILVRACFFTRDVTEGKLAADALKHSEERLRLAQQAAGLGTWEQDPVTGHTTWSSERYLLFGIDPARPDFLELWAKAIEPADWEEVSRTMEAASRTGSFNVEYRYHHPRKGIRWITSVGQMMETDRGRRLVGISIDQTDRKQLELKLQETLHQLREADRRKDEFLATLAHELRNPLAPVRNAVEILRLKAPPDPVVARARDLIDRQIGHMVRLVDDLLDVSRITRGKITLKRAAVDLTAAIEAALETSRPLIELYRHELSVSLPAEPIEIEGDLTRLAQMISNLLNNAAKYTPAHGRIELAVERQGSDAVIRVKDNGVGIPPEMLPRIFELFTQVDRSLERAVGGLGIGLTLVKQLVEMHGGTVEARSEGEGRGSEFLIRLPIRAEDLVHARPVTSVPMVMGAVDRRLRILVADDNLDAAGSLATILELEGHEVFTAHDGAAALAVAEREVPNVIILDIGMPGKNGFEVASAIRETGWGKRLVLVAVTGWGQEQDRARSQAAGFDYHLTKPVDLHTLAEIIKGHDAAVH